jgi:diguanylate cyclase (GGDEF)-like protein
MYRLLRRFSSYHSHWQIAAVAALFILVAAILSALVTHSIFEMRQSADAMDDQRALKAAEVAVLSLKQRLSATVRDNAEWDDAYVAMDSENAAAWAYENWGRTSTDYELYDGAVVTARDGSVVSSYWKGEIFDPYPRLGPLFARQIRYANQQGGEPVVAFQRVDDMLLLIGSLAIQPHADQVTAARFNVLTFFKIIESDVMERISNEYQLRNLSLSFSDPAPGTLELTVADVTGTTVAHLQWPRVAPGTKVFRQVLGPLSGALLLFILFLIGILLAAGFEASRLRRVAARERWNATHDRLSGLLNRAGLVDSLKTSGKGSQGLASLHLIDLDGFKQVNDTWGHAVGDELIQLVARRLLSVCDQRSKVARLGGDEFAILAQTEGDAMAFSNLVISELAKPFDIGGRIIEIGASVGVAFADDQIQPLEFLRRADMSLYQAKESGRGRAIAYSIGIDEERDRRTSLEGKLRAAIQNKEIRPAFQPLVSAISGQICGVEALARWETPAGFVSPDVFIPLAERAGLIDALGYSVLEQSVANAKAWIGLDLSVNVSPLQLCNPSFPEQVKGLLERESYDPRRLTLEITEGVLMSNPELSRRAMDNLREIGVKFALDDFGCGYASIGALKQFGFERMKIDKSLVWASEEAGQGSGVLEATIALAAALDIPVTAEGVETMTQASLLRSAGCQQLQGYLVGKPMSVEEMEQALQERGAAA